MLTIQCQSRLAGTSQAPSRRQAMAVRPSRSNTQLHSARPTPEASQDEEPSASPFDRLMDRFLNRASSSLKRGTATCLVCKGQGACSCPLCQGSGLMDKDSSRMNMVRHATQKMKEVLHVDRASYSTEWLQTNRCRRCHGSGLILCTTCSGLGVRSPAPTKH